MTRQWIGRVQTKFFNHENYPKTRLAPPELRKQQLDLWILRAVEGVLAGGSCLSGGRVNILYTSRDAGGRAMANDRGSLKHQRFNVRPPL